MLILIFFIIFTFYDIKTKQIPLTLILLYGFIAIVVNFINGDFSNWDFIIRLMPGLILLLTALITNESIGYGDGLIITITGLKLDIQITVTFILIAFLLSTITSVFLLITKKGNRQTKLPFMPYLLMAWCICLVWI